MVSEALYLTDPDGLGIEVYRDRPRADWIVRNGLVMGGSDPIDSSGLLGAAQGAAFDGMPAGTRMGHVHFHVGDLDDASAFYHAALGFDRVPFPLPGALFVSAGGYHHHVGLNIWAAGSPAASDQDARLLEWELRLPSAIDVGAVAASLADAGYDVAAGIHDARSSDPWGITVRICAESDPP
jgi:catechol 2,3-dioxygenase